MSDNIRTYILLTCPTALALCLSAVLPGCRTRFLFLSAFSPLPPLPLLPDPCLAGFCWTERKLQSTVARNTDNNQDFRNHKRQDFWGPTVFSHLPQNQNSKSDSGRTPGELLAGNTNFEYKAISYDVSKCPNESVMGSGTHQCPKVTCSSNDSVMQCTWEGDNSLLHCYISYFAPKSSRYFLLDSSANFWTPSPLGADILYEWSLAATETESNIAT